MRGALAGGLALAIQLGLAATVGAQPEAGVGGVTAEERKRLAETAAQVMGPLPPNADSPDNPYTEAKADLGRMLYYEARISRSQTISCNSCHLLSDYGQDHEPTSPGHEGKRGERNSPTVYNAGLHVAQFWDGRAATLEEQAKGPILNPVEMGMMGESDVLGVLGSMPGYVEAFEAAFPGEDDPITYDNVARAIGAFERRLMTPGRFDAFVTGDLDALDDAEVAGLRTFVETGCITCHIGPAVGGTLYRKLGQMKPYPVEDPGRFAVTGEESDRGVFKVPSLRNVAETAPYFHDGSIASLDQAIRIMAEHQLGRTLDDAQVASIRTFLESLTGRVDESYVAKPELPAGGPETPGPDPG